VQSKVESHRKNITQYGFPSTLNSGKDVKQFVDKDPKVENSNLISKENYI